MIKLSARAQALIEARKHEYIKTLPVLADELRKLVASTTNKSEKDTHTLLHKLSGSAGLYQLNKIQQLATELSQLPKPGKSNPEKLEELIESLKKP